MSLNFCYFILNIIFSFNTNLAYGVDSTEGGVTCTSGDCLKGNLSAPAAAPIVVPAATLKKTELQNSKCDNFSEIAKKCFINSDGSYIANQFNQFKRCQMAAGTGLIKGVYDGIRSLAVDLPSLVLLAADASLGTTTAKDYKAGVQKLEDKVKVEMAIAAKKNALANPELRKKNIEVEAQFMRLLGRSDDQISKMMIVASKIDMETAKELRELVESKNAKKAVEVLENPEANPNIFIEIMSQITKFMTNNFGCVKWKDGHTPFAVGSICEKSWAGLNCNSCPAVQQLFCGSATWVAGNFTFATKVLGVAIKYLDKSAGLLKYKTEEVGDKVQNLLAQKSKGKVPNADELSYTSLFFDKVADIVKNAVSPLKDGIKDRTNAIVESFDEFLAANKFKKIIAATGVTQIVQGRVQKFLDYVETQFYSGYGGTAAVLKIKQIHASAEVQKLRDQINTMTAELADDVVKQNNSAKKALAERQIASKQQDLVRAEKKLVDLSTDQQLAVLNDRVEAKYSELVAKAQREPSWTTLDSTKKAQELEKLKMLAQNDYATNFAQVLDYYKFRSQLSPGTSAEEVVEKFANQAHTGWQKTRAFSNPKEETEAWLRQMETRISSLSPSEKHLVEFYKNEAAQGRYLKNNPRIFPVSGRGEFVKDENGKFVEAVDIANTEFSKLPSVFREDNRKLAQNFNTVFGVLPDYRLAVENSAIYKLIQNIDLKGSDSLQNIYKAINKSFPSGLPKEDPLVKAAAFELSNFIERSGAPIGRLVGGNDLLQPAINMYQQKLMDPGNNQNNQ